MITSNLFSVFDTCVKVLPEKRTAKRHNYSKIPSDGSNLSKNLLSLQVSNPARIK